MNTVDSTDPQAMQFTSLCGLLQLKDSNLLHNKRLFLYQIDRYFLELHRMNITDNSGPHRYLRFGTLAR
jgi:hypothetical protein